MSGPTHWYRAYGLRIRSAVALPFDPLPDSGAFEPDVTVRLGAVPETLPACNGHSIRGNRWQADPAPSSCAWRTSPGIWSPADATC